MVFKGTENQFQEIVILLVLRIIYISINNEIYWHIFSMGKKEFLILAFDCNTLYSPANSKLNGSKLKILKNKTE